VVGRASISNVPSPSTCWTSGRPPDASAVRSSVGVVRRLVIAMAIVAVWPARIVPKSTGLGVTFRPCSTPRPLSRTTPRTALPLASLPSVSTVSVVSYGVADARSGWKVTLSFRPSRVLSVLGVARTLNS
jgi:hypothetical protein